MNNYTIDSCQSLIEKYVHTHKGECIVLEDGNLGLGKILLHSAEGKKTILIKEFYINEWSSGHSIRMYNKMPKKYQQILN